MTNNFLDYLLKVLDSNIKVTTKEAAKDKLLEAKDYITRLMGNVVKIDEARIDDLAKELVLLQEELTTCNKEYINVVTKSDIRLGEILKAKHADIHFRISNAWIDLDIIETKVGIMVNKQLRPQMENAIVLERGVAAASAKKLVEQEPEFIVNLNALMDVEAMTKTAKQLFEISSGLEKKLMQTVKVLHTAIPSN